MAKLESQFWMKERAPPPPASFLLWLLQEDKSCPRPSDFGRAGQGWLDKLGDTSEFRLDWPLQLGRMDWILLSHGRHKESWGCKANCNPQPRLVKFPYFSHLLTYAKARALHSVIGPPELNSGEELLVCFESGLH